MVKKRRNQKEIPTKKTTREKIVLLLGTYNVTKKIYSKISEQLFSNRRPLSYAALTKNMKTYISCKQHKISTPNTKQLKPP